MSGAACPVPGCPRPAGPGGVCVEHPERERWARESVDALHEAEMDEYRPERVWAAEAAAAELVRALSREAGRVQGDGEG